MFAKRDDKLTKTSIPCVYNYLTRTERRLVREEYIKRQNGMCHYCENDVYDEPSHGVASMEVNSVLFLARLAAPSSVITPS